MSINTVLLQNVNISIAVKEPTHNRLSFCQTTHRKFGQRFDTANYKCENYAKNVFKIAKLQSLTKYRYQGKSV